MSGGMVGSNWSSKARTAQYDRYANRPLPGDTAKIDRRQSISAVDGRLKDKSTVGGRLNEKSTVGGRLRKKREEEEEEEEKKKEEEEKKRRRRKKKRKSTSPARPCRLRATFLPTRGDGSRAGRENEASA
ncbi:hypothetical protein B296_00058177, partial [Ensete ventricosum]